MKLYCPGCGEETGFMGHICAPPQEQQDFTGGLAAREEAVLGAASQSNPKTERRAFLERKREATKADLLLKFEDGDYRGVQGCASDLRDIESELRGLLL